MNYELVFERVSKLNNQINLLQDQISKLILEKDNLKSSLDITICQSDNPDSDPEVAKLYQNIADMKFEIDKKSLIMESLKNDLKTLPFSDAQKTKEFSDLYDQFKHLCKTLDKFAEKWNPMIEALEKMAIDIYPDFERFAKMNLRLHNICRDLNIQPDLKSEKIVKHSFWDIIDNDPECNFKLWRLLVSIPENGNRWILRRLMRKGNLIKVEN